jgi:hypothetical protein
VQRVDSGVLVGLNRILRATGGELDVFFDDGNLQQVLDVASTIRRSGAPFGNDRGGIFVVKMANTHGGAGILTASLDLYSQLDTALGTRAPLDVWLLEASIISTVVTDYASFPILNMDFAPQPNFLSAAAKPLPDEGAAATSRGHSEVQHERPRGRIKHLFHPSRVLPCGAGAGCGRNELARVIRTAWCDAGVWTLLRLLIRCVWTSGRPHAFPPAGCVGRVSTSSAATERGPWHLRSVQVMRLRRDPYTWPSGMGNPPQWRLICAWAISPLHSHPSKFGPQSGPFGKRWSREGDGEETSPPPTPITSTSVH